MMMDNAFETLKMKIKSDQALLEKLAGMKEIDDVAKLLAGIAEAENIAITAEEITTRMKSSLSVETGKELDDATLELVSGGGSPYCIFTDGCYCMCTGKFTENWA